MRAREVQINDFIIMEWMAELIKQMKLMKLMKWMKWMKWKWKFKKDISIGATDKTQG